VLGHVAERETLWLGKESTSSIKILVYWLLMTAFFFEPFSSAPSSVLIPFSRYIQPADEGKLFHLDPYPKLGIYISRCC
jgi:hypothetical protein